MPAYSIMKLTWCKDFINNAYAYSIMKLTWCKDFINNAYLPNYKTDLVKRFHKQCLLTQL